MIALTQMSLNIFVFVSLVLVLHASVTCEKMKEHTFVKKNFFVVNPSDSAK